MKSIVSPVYLGFLVAGSIFMAIGLFGMSPIKLNRAFFWQYVPLSAMLTIGTVFLFRSRTGPFGEWARPVMLEWMSRAIQFGSRYFPLMFLLCILMSLGAIVVRVYSVEIVGFMKAHHILGFFFGAWMTPTTNSMIPVVEGLWPTTEMKPMCLYFMQASALMSLPLFMLRQMGFTNNEMSVKMYISGCIIAICMLPLAVPLFRLTELIFDFGSTIHSMLSMTSGAILGCFDSWI